MNSNYVVKYIKTKNKIRKIITYSENSSMRLKHTNIAKFINSKAIPSKFSKGYIKKQSIFTNSSAHMYNDIFIKFDIKSFFNNINHSTLIELLYKELKKAEPRILKTECAIIVKECSVEEKGLPLGLITSPSLSNIYLKEFDNILYGKLKKMGLNNIIYTRYADDMVISYKESENDNLDRSINDIKNLIIELLKKYHLRINESKQQVVNLNTNNHVRVTGISITKLEDNYRRLSVGRNQKRKLYFRAINCYKTGNIKEIKRVKGLQSFYLSIEKNKEKYESFMSDGMKKYIKDQYGYESIKELIDNLKY